MDGLLRYAYAGLEILILGINADPTGSDGSLIVFL